MLFRSFFGVTIYCNAADQMREHFPELNDFRLVRLGDSIILVNRRSDGGLELRDDLIFHGGPGSTLEIREFGITELKAKLLAGGFSEVRFLTEDIPELGIIFDHDVSQPLVAAKAPFAMSRSAVTQLINQWESARELARQVYQISGSRWLRLGRKLGLGPKLE